MDTDTKQLLLVVIDLSEGLSAALNGRGRDVGCAYLRAMRCETFWTAGCRYRITTTVHSEQCEPTNKPCPSAPGASRLSVSPCSPRSGRSLYQHFLFHNYIYCYAVLEASAVSPSSILSAVHLLRCTGLAPVQCRQRHYFTSFINRSYRSRLSRPKYLDGNQIVNEL